MQIDSLTRRCCVFGIFRGRSAIYALVLVTVWLALAGQGVWLTAAEDDLESGQEAKKKLMSSSLYLKSMKKLVMRSGRQEKRGTATAVLQRLERTYR